MKKRIKKWLKPIFYLLPVGIQKALRNSYGSVYRFLRGESLSHINQIKDQKAYRKYIHKLAAEHKSSGQDSIPDYGSYDLALQVLTNARQDYPKLTVPKFDRIEVTIILPVFNQFAYTYRAIASILLSASQFTYEILVADDGSDDETVELENYVANVTHIRNKENLMFLKNCNKAADQARGKYLFFLNNDVEITHKCIDRMVALLKERSDAGIVGGKLLYEDGSLQEAGGIVWNNGLPWNVRLGDDPFMPEYNYVRQVDYVSGAAMMISKELWLALDGFDEAFVPAYFEDTDLAFRARELGWNTYYQPQAVIYHFEGKSHGTDVRKGVKRYQEVNFSTFKDRWLPKVEDHGSEGVDLQLQKDRGIQGRILVLDYDTPRADIDAGSYAAIQEMSLLQTLGFKLTFVPENMRLNQQYAGVLQNMGIEVLYLPYYRSLRDVVNRRGGEFDAVYITRFTVAERVIDLIKREYPGMKIIFNNADLHFVRELRYAQSQGTSIKTAENTKRRELEVIRKADAVLCYNETEHAIIKQEIPDIKTLWLNPWIIEPKPNARSFEATEHLSFLGNFNHPPNLQAIAHFLNNIWPQVVDQYPDLKIQIYGSNMQDRLDIYRNLPGVEVIGYVEDLKNLFSQTRIFVSPLLSGAGIKGKILESMAWGVPTITSPVSIEGTHLRDGHSTIIAETPDEWVNAIEKLYFNKSNWQQISKNARAIIETNFSRDIGLKRYAEMAGQLNLVK